MSDQAPKIKRKVGMLRISGLSPSKLPLAASDNYQASFFLKEGKDSIITAKEDESC